MSHRNTGGGHNVAKVVTFDSTQQQVAVYKKSDPNEVRTRVARARASDERTNPTYRDE